MMANFMAVPKGDQELRQAFQVFDRDGNGKISADELRQVMEKMGENLTEEEVNEMIRSVDTDNNNMIEYEGNLLNLAFVTFYNEWRCLEGQP